MNKKAIAGRTLVLLIIGLIVFIFFLMLISKSQKGSEGIIEALKEMIFG